jgi:hypothetical protein
MTHDVTIAVLADWLPKFDPPFGDNGFDKPYQDRLKLDLAVDGAETLASVYERAIEHWQPRVSADSLAQPENLMEVIYWVWFYLPEDERGLHHRYELATDLILVDEDGRARWNLAIAEIPYGHIVRAGQQGLLRGDPLRPYLPLLVPQGGGAFQVGWETLLSTWTILEALIVARGAYALGSEAQQLLLKRLRRRHVVEVHSAEWADRGGDPRNVSRTIDRKPWSPDDLRIVMNVPTIEDAEDLLALFGHEPNPAGEYVVSETDEARILRLAEEDVFDTFATGASDAELRPRLERLLATGELPPDEPPDVVAPE